MDGLISAGLISGGIVLSVNAIGWAITLVRGSNQEAKLRGAFEQKLTDICGDVDSHTEDIKEVKGKIDKVDEKLTNHIVHHGRRTK